MIIAMIMNDRIDNGIVISPINQLCENINTKDMRIINGDLNPALVSINTKKRILLQSLDSIVVNFETGK